jgi:hypothetical protein
MRFVRQSGCRASRFDRKREVSPNSILDPGGLCEESAGVFYGDFLARYAWEVFILPPVLAANFGRAHGRFA